MFRCAGCHRYWMRGWRGPGPAGALRVRVNRKEIHFRRHYGITVEPCGCGCVVMVRRRRLCSRCLRYVLFQTGQCIFEAYGICKFPQSKQMVQVSVYGKDFAPGTCAMAMIYNYAKYLSRYRQLKNMLEHSKFQ